MIVGYARTSTIEQVAGLEGQIKSLFSSGCEKIFKEQVSSISERDELKKALDFVREGDVFVVDKLDRLARSTADLLKISQALENKKVSLRILNLGMDTSTPTGKMLLTMMGAIAQFEREIMLERQREGIAKAKAEGKYKGRKPIPKEVVQQVLELCQTRLTRKEVGRRVKLGEASIYRILKEQKCSSVSTVV